MGYYEKFKVTTDIATSVSASVEYTVTFASGIECGMGDDVEGLSAQEV